MPKDNIERAIDKSSAASGANFENLRYEGFGPNKIAVIVETLTDNKNRTASNVRTIFQKSGGSLGTQGSASHNYKQLGIIKIDKNEISEDKIFELAIEAGQRNVFLTRNFMKFNVFQMKFIMLKNLENTIANFISTDIEWVPINSVDIQNDEKENVIEFLESRR